MPSPRRPGIQSIRRADAILNVVAIAAQNSASLAEIASSTGLNTSTAYSLVQTLLELDYLAQDRTSRRYSLGTRTFELGRSVENRLDIIERCRLAMIRLSTVTRETISLAVPSHLSAVIVSTVESNYAVRGASFQGRRVPYHASAVGKAMLAGFPAEHRNAILDAHPPERITARTISDKAVLVRELGETRERGYALSLDEEEVGARAVAAPIYDRFGDVCGALAVWGPSNRFPNETLRSYGHLVASECRNLSSSIASSDRDSAGSP